MVYYLSVRVSGPAKLVDLLTFHSNFLHPHFCVMTRLSLQSRPSVQTFERAQMERHELGIFARYPAKLLDGSALRGCILVGRLSIFSLLRAHACIVMVEFIKTDIKRFQLFQHQFALHMDLKVYQEIRYSNRDSGSLIQEPSRYICAIEGRGS